MSTAKRDTVRGIHTSVEQCHRYDYQLHTYMCYKKFVFNNFLWLPKCGTINHTITDLDTVLEDVRNHCNQLQLQNTIATT